MRKILYLMHVDWLWIRQRPHFIAEGLSDNNFVIVLYRPHLKKFKIIRNKNFLAMPMIPIPRFNSVLESFDSIMNRLLVKLISIVIKPELVYLTSPAMFSYLRNSEIKTIYDCMDDLVEFSQLEIRREKIRKIEYQTIKESHLTIFSSDHLSRVVRKRFNFNFNSLVVRNGISDSIKAIPDELRPSDHMRYIYFGTIAEWFDFDSVIFALNTLDNLEIVLYGPSTVEIPDHPRLVYMGQRAHADLLSEVKDSYGYIMPFVINDLVLSVDPVKIYEYIALGRRIIASDYPEIMHFGDLIQRYSSPENLVKLLLNMQNIDDNYSERNNFILRSSWKMRVSKIEKAFNEI